MIEQQGQSPEEDQSQQQFSSIRGPGVNLVHGFEVLRREYVKDINAEVTHYRHAKSGAELLSVQNDDENKTFAAGFGTPPFSHNGLPHILEHTVLTGSQRYPVKDPFMAMSKSSLNTFLNAMTYPDFTLYPVSSMNEKDYYNLVDVYMDAVFNPLLREESFEQEGWHYAVDESATPASVRYGGVVFNEMKGYFSTPSSHMYLQVERALYPDTAYGNSSGGDPRHIPELNFAEFVDFHKTYYHPSNAKLYFFGNDAEEKRLEKADEFLQKFDATPVDSSIALQPAFSAPRVVEETYPVAKGDDLSEKHLSTVNWLLPEANDQVRSVGFHVLQSVLLGSVGAPLYKSLIESGIGSSLITGGLQPYRRQWSFSVGLDGMQDGKGADLEAVVVNTLQDLSQHGIDSELIDAAVHQFELELRKYATRADQGMQVLDMVIEGWLHGDEPFEELHWEKALTAFKDELQQNPRYVEELIETYFLQNQSRVRVDLTPDPDFEDTRRKEEASALKQFQDSLSPQELTQLTEKHRARELFQKTPDTPAQLSSLPRLERSDLNPSITEFGATEEVEDGIRFLTHDIETNGLTFQSLSLPVDSIPRELLPYMKLYARCLTQLGLEHEDYSDLAKRMLLKTDGVSSRLSVMQHTATKDPMVSLDIGGGALEENAEVLFDIMIDCIEHVDFSRKERFSEILTQERARIERSLSSQGHSIALTRLGAGGDLTGALKEELYGLEYLKFLQDLEQRLDTDWDDVQQTFEQIKEIVSSTDGALVDVAGCVDTWDATRTHMQSRLAGLPKHPQQKQDWDNDRDSNEVEGIAIASPVNYVAWSVNLYNEGYQKHGSMEVLRKILANEYLWKNVREQGGAYGCFTSFNEHTGEFACCSYRDPNVADTVAVYEGIADYLRNLSLDDEEILQYIVGAIGTVDSPHSAVEKMHIDTQVHLTERSPESRQQYRDELLGTTLNDISAYAELFEKAALNARIAIAGNEKDIEKAKDSALKDLCMLSA